MLFFLRHVRYCNLTAIFMPRAYSAESVTGVLDWDHDRAGGIDGDLTVGLHLGGDIVRYGEQRVEMCIRDSNGGWINDPNGLCFYKGLWHVFYQLHPYGTQWGPMHWGHVSSTDMLSWKREPIMFAPSLEQEKDEMCIRDSGGAQASADGHGTQIAGPYHGKIAGHTFD